jgi:AraC-like DNA-binding protein
MTTIEAFVAGAPDYSLGGNLSNRPMAALTTNGLLPALGADSPLVMPALYRSGAARPRTAPRAAEPHHSPYPLGSDMAKRFNLPSAQAQATTTLKSAQLTIARLVSKLDGIGLSSPLPIENAYLVGLHLCDSPSATFWTRQQRVSAGPFVAGSIAIAHLEDEPVFDLPAPFDLLLLHIPLISFEEMADEHHAPRIGELGGEVGSVDPVILNLGRALLPTLELPGRFGRLYFDHIAFAMYARLAVRYGRQGQAAPEAGPRLTARQERIAKEILSADLTLEPSIADVAMACGISTGRFLRAFRNSIGNPPHRWLRGFRVERAKELMVSSPLSLAQVAYECGFADQSHFSRVFTSSTGIAPGAWRRMRRG